MLTPAERLLQELGITEPSEIDLEAIAYHVGARIRYATLRGCEARIIGHRDKAIVTVSANSSCRRKRFSIAHELGHWHHHRGKSLVCRAEEYRPGNALSSERVADGFGADLLMPHYLFRPRARQHPQLNFKTVKTLADTFETSHTATAIRLVEGDHSPTVLICHGQRGRKWFTRAPAVPPKWFPRSELDAASFAFGIVFGNEPDDRTPRRIGADAWFDRWDAGRYEIYEQTMRTGHDEALTIVLLTDPAMLEE